LENIDQASITEICHIQGKDAAKAQKIKAALEFRKRMPSKPEKK
jgi:hypothetical protein